MTSTTPVFNLTIIPDVSEPGSSYCRFTLCFDVNSRHEVFNQSDDLTRNNEWIDAAKKFPDEIRTFLNSIDIYVAGRSIGKAVIEKDFPDTDDVQEIRKQVWAELLTPVASEKRKQIFIPVVPEKDIPGNQSYTIMHPDPGFDDIVQIDSLTDFGTKYLNSRTDQELREKRKKVRAGLGEAMSTHQLENRIRNQRMADMNEAQFNELKNYHFAALNAQVAKTTMTSVTKSRLQNMIEAIATHTATLDLSTHGAEYIRQAFNHVNNYSFAARFLNTRFTIHIDRATLPQMHPTQLVRFLVKAVPPQSNKYIDCSFGTECVRYQEAAHIIFPAPATKTPIHSKGIFSMFREVAGKPNHQLLNFEPEAVAQNTYTAAAGDPVEPLIANTKLNIPVVLKDLARLGVEEKRGLLAKISVLRQAQEIARKQNNAITNTATKGQSLYLNQEISFESDQGTSLNENDLVKGYAVFVRKKGDTDAVWQSLTERTEEFFVEGHNNLRKGPEIREAGIHINMGQETTVDAAGNDTGQPHLAKSNFLFTWDGTAITASNPMQQQEEKTDEEENIAEKLATKDDLLAEIQALQCRAKKLVNIDVFPFSGKKANLLTKQSFNFGVAARLKLKLGQSYDYLLVPQYHNDAVLLKDVLQQKGTSPYKNVANDHCTKLSQPFTRWNHVNEFHIATRSQIFTDASNREPRKGFYGESAKDLVVRSGNSQNTEDCSRFILPPPVPSLQLYLWYDRSESTQLKSADIRDWYLRYQKGVEQPIVYDNKLHYLPDPIVTGFTLRFYSDPEYTIPFYFDNSNPVNVCDFTGKYPNIKPWRLILQRDHNPNVSDPKKLRVDPKTHTIVASLKPGKQVYLEIIPKFDQQVAHFQPGILKKFVEPDMEDGSAMQRLFSNITRLTLTHASERPLRNPSIEQVNFIRYHKDSTEPGKVKDTAFKIEVSARFEHLNLWNGVQVPGVLPSGEMELYALWNDFSPTKEGIHHSIDTRETNEIPFQGYIKIGDVKFADMQGKNGTGAVMVSQANRTNDEYQDHVSTLVFVSDPAIQVPHHSTLKLRLRNTSRFAAYFPPANADDNSKERYSRWSQSKLIAPTPATTGKQDIAHMVAAPVLLNNQPMQSPKVAKILALKLTDIYADSIKENRNWARIYFEPFEMNKSGEGHRVGIVLKSASKTAYEKIFSHQLSQLGSDAVTDPVGTLVHTKGNYLVGEDLFDTGLPKYYTDAFDPKHVTGTDHSPELMTYRPKFDAEQELWYIDVGFNTAAKFASGFHLLFSKLNFVHYQQYAANYQQGAVTTEDFRQDYRFSLPTENHYCTIRPARTFKRPWVMFSGPQQKFTFSIDTTTLYFQGARLRTQFFLFVEQRLSGDFWTAIHSKRHTTKEAIARFHGLLPVNLQRRDVFQETFGLSWEGLSTYGPPNFRIVIMEIDYHDAELDLAALHATLASAGNGISVIDIPGVKVNNISLVHHPSLPR